MAERPEVVLVAAMGRNRVIGLDGGMPWHLPADLKHFKRVTLGHPVIMGRKTFESIGRPLPGRRNVIVSRSLANPPDGCLLARSLDEALADCSGARAMVIGGGELYRAALPLAGGMELTLIDANPEGDTRFPRWVRADWRLAACEVLAPGPGNTCRLVFASFQRVDTSGNTSVMPG